MVILASRWRSPANQSLKLTGAAISVSRDVKVLQAARQLSVVVRIGVRASPNVVIDLVKREVCRNNLSGLATPPAERGATPCCQPRCRPTGDANRSTLSRSAAVVDRNSVGHQKPDDRPRTTRSLRPIRTSDWTGRRVRGKMPGSVFLAPPFNHNVRRQSWALSRSKWSPTSLCRPIWQRRCGHGRSLFLARAIAFVLHLRLKPGFYPARSGDSATRFCAQSRSRPDRVL